MKITGIDIKGYRQFDNLKLDFIYPTEHPLAGSPLKKVCFIGQSGTGKTTLLREIYDIFDAIDETIPLVSNLESEVGNLTPLVKYTFSHDKRTFFSNWENNENFIYKDFKDWILDNKIDEIFNETNKACIFINESVLNKVEGYLINQKNVFLEGIKDILTSTQEIESKKKSINDELLAIENKKVIDFDTNIDEIKLIWSYLLQDIFTYDLAAKQNALKFFNNIDTASLNNLIQQINKWKKDNPNPRKTLSQFCLNPILDKFHLTVDIENDEAAFVIKTVSDRKVGYDRLSTGTKQVLSTAIPIYKLNTKDTVILFDEPERSLFPDLQRTIIDYYTGLAPDSQFFFATHSPIIASAFEPCERFILYFDEEGNVRCRNGVAPVGDDPNDILSQDFEMSPLMTDKGMEAYNEYLNLGTKIVNEKDPKKKDELINKRMKLGNQYNF